MKLRTPVLASLIGWLAATVWIHHLTLELNPHLASSFSDRLGLLMVLGAFYCVPAVAAGMIAGAILLVAGQRWRALRLAMLSWLSLLPVVWAAMLPQSELTGERLSNLIFGRDPLALLAAGVLTLSSLAAIGLAAAACLRSLLGVTGRPPRWVMAIAALCLLATAFIFALRSPAVSRNAEIHRVETVPVVPTDSLPTPVVLLCVDGADLRVIEALVADGQLPTFARLKREGSWGNLESIQPGLSAVIWTTIATGRPPAAHGIHHFVYYQLPGIGNPILQFPLHTGLNFTILPAIDRLPGSPSLRQPYTSTMRQTRALWNIAGEHFRVGAYRWLVTWPAEPVNGFMISQAVYAEAEELGQLVVFPEDATARGEGVAFPPELAGVLSKPANERADPSSLLELQRRFPAREITDISPGPIRATLVDPTLEHLVSLQEGFRPTLTLASFYPVDVFHHRFAADWVRKGPAATEIPHAYRILDDRLGRLMDSLANPTNLIVISDHGFDFQNRHHTWGPPGVIFAHGPSFGVGRQVEGLSVYDIAPLALHLLGLPVADDMPGAQDLLFGGLLAPGLLDSRPVRSVPTYETGEKSEPEGRVYPDRERLLEHLRSLGYIS